MLNRPWQEAWARLSEIPAMFMGLQNELAVQQPATFCVLRIGGENQLTDLKVYTNGASA